MKKRDNVFWGCSIFIVTFLTVFLISCSPLEERTGHSDKTLPSEKTQPSEGILPSETQIYSHDEKTEKTSPQKAPPKQSPIWTPLDGCEEKERVTFTSLPLPIEKITAVEPQGELTGFKSGHITPGDHIGFRYDSAASPIDVFALADGYLVRVERNPGYFGLEGKNYHLYFEYSCSMFGSYVHLTEINQLLLQADQKLKDLDSRSDLSDNDRNLLVHIPVKAGQVIGKTQKWGLLGMLTVDTSVTLFGLENPKVYSGEPWKTHAVPALNYFSEPLKTQLMTKNPRTVEPRGGKIDFDLPGKLVGNWFKEGTDYAGDRSKPFCGDYICPYWESHLSFVYDYVNPTQIRVSIGYDAGLQDQGPYGVKGNSPDHRDIVVDTGMIAYELVKLKDVTAAHGFPVDGKPLFTENSNELLGVLLVQMLEPRRIKMEVLPGKTKEQAAGFTEKAQVYYR